MAGPIVHHYTMRSLSTSCAYTNVQIPDAGSFIKLDNIYPDLHKNELGSHGFNWAKNAGSIFEKILYEAQAVYQNYNTDKYSFHVRNLLHYVVDSMTIGQIDADLHGKATFLLNKDDIIDLKGEFCGADYSPVKIDTQMTYQEFIKAVRAASAQVYDIYHDKAKGWFSKWWKTPSTSDVKPMFKFAIAHSILYVTQFLIYVHHSHNDNKNKIEE